MRRHRPNHIASIRARTRSLEQENGSAPHQRQQRTPHTKCGSTRALITSIPVCTCARIRTSVRVRLRKNVHEATLQACVETLRIIICQHNAPAVALHNQHSVRHVDVRGVKIWRGRLTIVEEAVNDHSDDGVFIRLETKGAHKSRDRTIERLASTMGTARRTPPQPHCHYVTSACEFVCTTSMCMYDVR